VMQLAVPGRDRHPGARLPRGLRAVLAGHALAQIVFGAGALLWTDRSDASLSSSSKSSTLACALAPRPDRQSTASRRAPATPRGESV
jgi:hypothetical protein